MINFEDYSTLLEEMSLEQGLGLVLEELPLIVYCTNVVYTLCYLVRETDKNLVIVCPDEAGHEFVKVVNKDFVESVEIVYQELLDKMKEKSFCEDDWKECLIYV